VCVVALPPRSLPSVVMVTRQPLFMPPMMLATGARDSVRNVSVKCDAPWGWRIGRSSMPFEDLSSLNIGRST